jgi:IclR family transcriptional regulator, KDG regulon repressor
MEKLPQYGNIQVIDRAVRILDVVSETGGATLSAIGARSSLPLSTVSRILDSLASHALIERDEDGRTYRLGRRLLTLSSGVRQQSADLIRLGHPLLEQLAVRSGEDVGLSRLQGAHAVIIDRVEGPNHLKIIDVLGKPEPLYCGAFRKVLLAYQSPEWIEKYLASVKFVRFTPNTLRSKAAVRDELTAIRQRGFASSFGERLPDAAGVAAPIFGIGSDIEAAVFIVVPTTRFTAEKSPQLAGLVKEVARQLTGRMRGESRPPVHDSKENRRQYA